MKHPPKAWRQTLRPRMLLPYLLIALLASVEASFAEKSSIVYTKHKVDGIVAHVVTINLNDPDVKLTPAITKHGIGTSESFTSILNRTRPTAAITGAFFDTRSLHPVGDIVVDGEMVCRGVIGSAIGIGWNNEIEFFRTKKWEKPDWGRFQSVLCAGPRLLSNGNLNVYPRSEGFRDPKLYTPGIRTAVGVTKHGKLLFVTTKQPIYLSRLAKVMRALGARDAATLDGGGSTALYFRGRYISNPSRKLTSLLLAYDSLAGYEQARRHLTPSKPRISVSGTAGRT
jgi:hypothetical protein